MTITCIEDLAKSKGLETPEQLHRYVYKYTDCGAWINWTDESVTIGSIVEGSEAEFDRTFRFPVDSDTLDAWLTELELLCDEAWHEANDPDGFWADGTDGYRTVEELDHYQLEDLRCALLYGDCPEYDFLSEEEQHIVDAAFTTAEIPLSIVYKAFAGIQFSPDDF